MTKMTVEMDVCCFCLDFHAQYMKGSPFNNVRKVAVTDCRLCQEAMCNDCKASSSKELAEDTLAVY